MELFNNGYTPLKHKLKIEQIGCNREDCYGDFCVVTYQKSGVGPRSFIIDTGNENSYDKYLFKKEYDNVKNQLDFVLFTHWHNDHYGGANQHLDFKLLFGLMAGVAANRSAVVKKAYSKTGITIDNVDTFITSDANFFSDNPLQVVVYTPQLKNDLSIEENHYSLMPLIKCGAFGYLGLGDITKETFPASIAQNGVNPPVIKLPHHGSEGNILKNVSLMNMITANTICVISGLTAGGSIKTISTLLENKATVYVVLGEQGKGADKMESYQEKWYKTKRFALVTKLEINVDTAGKFQISGVRKKALLYGGGLADYQDYST